MSLTCPVLIVRLRLDRLRRCEYSHCHLEFSKHPERVCCLQVNRHGKNLYQTPTLLGTKNARRLYQSFA